MTASDIQLPKIAQTQINRLALAAGRSPAAMLRFVLRDGFEAVELSLQENALADAQFETGATTAHADVMHDAQAAIQQKKAPSASGCMTLAVVWSTQARDQFVATLRHIAEEDPLVAELVPQPVAQAHSHRPCPLSYVPVCPSSKKSSTN